MVGLGTELLSKGVIAADLDGTLSESKMQIDREMAKLISELLRYKTFAVIGGGLYKQFYSQLTSRLNEDSDLSNLYVFPANATILYKFMGKEWEKIYSEDLTRREREKILLGFEKALAEVGFVKPERIYGKLVEDRGTQVTFSAFGQDAPIGVKKGWDPQMRKRKQIVKLLKKRLLELR